MQSSLLDGEYTKTSLSGGFAIAGEANWGIDGYYRMRRGTNECNIEQNSVAGKPDFWYPYHKETVDWINRHFKMDTKKQQLAFKNLVNRRVGATFELGSYRRRN